MASIDVEEVLSKLSNKNKIDLLAGIDFWHTKAIPEHGVPSLRTSDGPNGVRGTRFFNGVRAACFPNGTALGATWDTELLHKAGVVMGEECIAKGAHVLLGPTINMQRSPLGGRGFESLSEDPVVAGLGAAALTAGVQSTGVVATLKHFVCNDQEHERMAYDAVLTERALREIYLMPFMIAERDAKPGAYMTAYNRVNGTHVSENMKILEDTLRKEWGFDGLVMSDWYGTYSTSQSVNAGLDLEMPGPSRWRGDILGHALHSQKVAQHTLDDRARKVLELVNRCAASGIKENAPEETRNTPETAALLRKIAGDAIVLMKNEKSILPLKKDKKTLVVGPNAKIATYCGGGSASLAAYYAVTPFDGIADQVEKDKISYTQGCYAHKELPLLGRLTKTAKGEPGVTFKAFNEPPTDSSRKCVDELSLTSTDMFLVDYVHPEIKDPLFYADVEGYLTAEEDGEFELGVGVYGLAKLYVDDKLVVDNETKQTQGTMYFGIATVEEKGKIPVKKGQTYHIKVNLTSGVASKLTSGQVSTPGAGLRLGGCMVIDPEKEVEKAATLAKDVDQVIICAGLNSDWECENTDRVDMTLPGSMNALISAIAKVNPSTVVVMQSGTPVEMPWIAEVPAMIHAWYGGNETGNGIADVLFGDVTPSGKLPLSFPVRNKDNPAYLSYRSERGRTWYSEDVYVGYRYYDTIEHPVLFPFGHGLSYTTFAMSGLKVANDGEHVTATLTLSNEGEKKGAEVVQVYVAQRSPSVRRPAKELKGFKKVELAPGEKKEVEVKILTKYATSFWDELRNAWISEKDTFEVLVDGSSKVSEKTLTATFEVLKTTFWNGL